MSNKEKYKKEIKSLRKLLDDNEYTRTLPTGYHHFLSDMHRKLIGNSNITLKMLSSIQNAAATYECYGSPQTRMKRDAMLSKITKLKYESEKMEFLDSITNRVHSRGTLTPKQAKYANQLHKQFNKRILP